MPYTNLLDGGLSVRVGGTTWANGTEYNGVVHGLEWDSVAPGGCGEAHFWVDVNDPMWPIGEYSNLRFGNRVAIDHTVDATTTRLYRGYIVSDPRTGYAGETSIVNVECGGPLQVAKLRGDFGITHSDCDMDECWIVNKRNNKIFSADASDCLEISVDKGETVPNSRAGVIGYVPYLGAQHLQSLQIGGVLAHNGVVRMEGSITADLGDHMRAVLFWSDKYNLERTMSDASIHIIYTWGAATNTSTSSTNRTPDSLHFDTSAFWAPADTAGKGYFGLGFFCTDADGRKMAKDRFVRIDNIRVYTSTSTHRLDQAIADIAAFVGLQDTVSTSAIDTVVPNMVVRPMTDPATGMNQYATQSDQLVEFGWWPDTSGNVTFIAKPLLKDWATIRALSNTGTVPRSCYKLTPSSGIDGNIWDVQRHPEFDKPVAVRVQYGRVGRQTAFPGGTPATCIAPADPGWKSSIGPFLGATASVLAVDMTNRNYGDEQGRKLAAKFYALLSGLAWGTSNIRTATIPVYAGGTRPAAYMQGGDFIEFATGTAAKDMGPLYITRVHVYADTGFADLEVGFSADLLMEQLQAAGAVDKAKLHAAHKYRKKRR